MAESSATTPEAPGAPSGLAALYTSALWARLNLLATLLAVFAVPIAALYAMTHEQSVEEWIRTALVFEAVISVFFLVDLLAGYAARGRKYAFEAVHWINLLALAAIGLQLAMGMAGVANARILRILPAIRAVAHLGLLSRGRVDDSPLGAEAVQRMNEQDTWYTLAVLALLSVSGQLTFGIYESPMAAIAEIVIYAGFVLIIRWKSASNRRHVQEVFIERIRSANRQVLDRMQEIPGLEDSDDLMEERARELHEEGRPPSEIEVMVEAIGMIISNLRRFISRRTFAEARGEQVLAPDRPVALMFTDVESFSRVSQAMGQAVIPVMKHYLGDMSERVFHCEGDVDKFIGDALFAYFDDSNDAGNAANMAFDAALGMQARCRWLADSSESWAELFSGHPDWRGYQLFRTRIGLHVGHVIAGPIGSDLRADSTLLGDDVNLAARLEAICKQYAAYYLMSEDFYQELSPERQAHCRWIDRASVAGREETTVEPLHRRRTRVRAGLP